MTGQGHSRFQQGVIRRYYENIDTIALQRLAEIVSDLYLEGGKSAKLWEGARKALEKIAPGDDRAANVLKIRSVTGMAKLVTDLQTDAKKAGSGANTVRPTVVEGIVGGGTGQQRGTSTAPQVEPGQAGAHGASEMAPGVEATGPGLDTAPPSSEQLKAAMKAFRKRLKLTKLDDESRLGNRAMTGGRQSEIAAIMPPREYPKAVWDELVKQGKLKSAGGSFYELTDG